MQVLGSSVGAASAIYFFVYDLPKSQLGPRHSSHMRTYGKLPLMTTACGVADLNQNPEFRPRHTTNNGLLSTLTCNSRGLDSCLHKRFTASEGMFLAQAFPCEEWASCAMGVAQQALDGVSASGRSRLAGNAMHGGMYGCSFGMGRVLFPDRGRSLSRG